MPVGNMWRVSGDHHDDWTSTQSEIERLAGLSKYAGRGTSVDE